MEASRRCIGLYGGTFNPVHNGHVTAVDSFLQCDKIDSLWVLLNPAPPHKPDEEFAPYSVRLAMLNEAFKASPNVKVSDLETRLPSPGYTVQTLHYLTSKYPEYSFYLCIGFDSYVEFHHWYKWKGILELCSLLVVERPAFEGKKPNPEVVNHSTFVAHQPVEASSSKIREKIEANKPVSQCVPPAVLAIIEEQKLYK